MSKPRKDKEFKIQHYHQFSGKEIQSVKQKTKDRWPVVYILSDPRKKTAYIGESFDIINRLTTHQKNPEKKKMKELHLITSDHFHKSATLDIESTLVQRFIGDYKLLNSPLHLSSFHNYYEQREYQVLADKIWRRLKHQKKEFQHLQTLLNSDIFKYSPYKVLSPDQYKSVLALVDMLNGNKATALVEGRAGTGKTVLAIFLMKILVTQLNELYADDDEPREEPLEEREKIIQLKKKYPSPSVALVVPMRSIRKTLKKVFRNIMGLKASMVIGPSDVFKKRYDILIVDEAHRLRQRKGITNYGSADANNKALGLGSEGTELDWVLRKCKKRILFYDRKQTVRPSDVPRKRFIALQKKSIQLKLYSQLRSRGGVEYADYIDSLLDAELKKNTPKFKHKDFEFLYFDHIADLTKIMAKREKEHQLARMVAGYGWEWKSKKEPNVKDISIENKQFRWNKKYIEWIHSENAAKEMGCIHTTQGYDLNYAGVIFGAEISYDPVSKKINIHSENFHDKKTKEGIDDGSILKEYILNSYRNMLYRGIRGVFVYALDPGLKTYLKQHIPSYNP